MSISIYLFSFKISPFIFLSPCFSSTSNAMLRPGLLAVPFCVNLFLVAVMDPEISHSLMTGRGQWIHSSILTPIWLFHFDSHNPWPAPVLHATKLRYNDRGTHCEINNGMDLSCPLIRSGYLISLILVATFVGSAFHGV
jgi:hypothetical protein